MIEPNPRPTDRAQFRGTKADARKTNCATVTATKFLIAASKKNESSDTVVTTIGSVAPYYASARHCILRLTPN